MGRAGPVTADLLALLSGGIVGLTLGLVGGGGSILAVPLLVYLVGVKSPHAAIGTAAIAVALNAFAGLIGHARAKTIKWSCAAVFAAAGAAGAWMGSVAGKAMDGQALLGLFGLLMILVGVLMLREWKRLERPDVRLTMESARHLLPRLVSIGFGVGLMAGFFGIGGGFLIVPGLMLATAMPIANAVGTSLVVVTTLGATTAASYALSGYVDWRLAALVIAGGIAGALIGARLALRLSVRKRMMTQTFATIVIAAGLYVTARGLMNLM